MTLQQLKYAIAVADQGSMNEAAKSLFISQPSLSGAIKEMEKELGFELFLRTSRGIVVTPEGERFDSVKPDRTTVSAASDEAGVVAVRVVVWVVRSR